MNPEQTPGKRLTRHKRGDVPLYAQISVGVFLCCVTFFLFFVFDAEKLTGYGLIDRVYYLVLVLMGLTAAGFLFGVLPSTATYEGKLWGGTLKLGGAIVGAALVVIGGYLFTPKTTTFPLTVFVHGRSGPQELVLRNSGSVALKLGPEIQRKSIGEKGEAFFAAIPANFRGQDVSAWVESDTYESVNGATKQRLDSSSLDLVVQRKMGRYEVAGTVFDTSGNPLPDVRVALPEYQVSSQSDENGRFALAVSAESQQPVDLVAAKDGYLTEHLTPTLGDPGVNFTLRQR